MLPEEDDALLAILSKHLPPVGKRWRLAIADTRGGSGNGLLPLPLPTSLLASLKWKPCDTMHAIVTEAGQLVLERRD